MLTAREIVKTYRLKDGAFSIGREIRALDGVSLVIPEGRTLGLVGESGSGKSTLARVMLRLIEPDSGAVLYDGREITGIAGTRLQAFRRSTQAVFQDPMSSLNPRMRLGEIVREPLELHRTLSKAEMDETVDAMLVRVGLRPSDRTKFPHEFSGGQRQRINIARALILRPSCLVADEPLSSLDVSIQAQILNLLMEMRSEYRFSMLFVSHDLRVVRHIADEIAVMHQGRIVEQGPPSVIFEQPADGYTRQLLSSLPERRIPAPCAR